MTSLLGMSSIRDLSWSGLLGFDGYSQADPKQNTSKHKSKIQAEDTKAQRASQSQKPSHPTCPSPFVPCGAFPGNYMTEP